MKPHFLSGLVAVVASVSPALSQKLWYDSRVALGKLGSYRCPKGSLVPTTVYHKYSQMPAQLFGHCQAFL